eukprot:500342_1
MYCNIYNPYSAPFLMANDGCRHLHLSCCKECRNQIRSAATRNRIKLYLIRHKSFRSQYLLNNTSRWIHGYITHAHMICAKQNKLYVYTEVSVLSIHVTN